MISAISVKDRLKKRADQNGKTMQEMLIVYGLERTIFRISVSEYADRFTLKGGILLYALFNGDYSRVTRDIDFSAKNTSNRVEDMTNVFGSIFRIHCDDALKYDLNTLEVKSITEFKEYHGVNVQITAYLDRTRVPVSIDIGFGDVVYPDRIKMEFPSLLDMNTPEVYAYSVYSVIAEKFEAIVSLGNANSRYKDYYDIMMIARNYDLNGNVLREAVRATFEYRQTGYDDIVVFEPGGFMSVLHQTRWNAFLNKKQALTDMGLEEVLSLIKELLEPVANSIKENEEYPFRWDHKKTEWRRELE